MTFDYLSEFPISVEVLPRRLLGLLQPIGLSPNQRVEVACLEESDPHGADAEHVHLLMAVVPGVDANPIKVVDEAGTGVVQFSVPAAGSGGSAADFSPSVSGYDYVVAAWGDGSFYSFGLAEKVWMGLGLTPRCVGNEQQRVIYDDLGLPEFDVAEGEVSSEYHWTLQGNVQWSMSNEYLRRYLWLRGARGVRCFFYQAQMEKVPEVVSLMGGNSHTQHAPTEGVPWYKLDLREHRGGILLQLWASVEALMPTLCPEQDADGVLWPGDEQPMTKARANALVQRWPVYLDDRFLCRYEESLFYDSTPVNVYGQWHCSPSYRGQWSFTDCRRVGRNVIEVPMRELYKPKPDREILHARTFALDPDDLTHIDFSEEHIVAKSDRFLKALLHLGDALTGLGGSVGLDKFAPQLTGFDRSEVRANGWLAYPEISRLAHVAPLELSQQEFLARCKSLHEIWQRVPDGYLKALLEHAGCQRSEVKKLGSLKLFQAILNIVQNLNADEEEVDAFVADIEPANWRERNESMAPLFVNYDLRIADAHESMGECLVTLQGVGFDIGSVNTGYGKALDFVMDRVIQTIETIATEIDELVARKHC